MHVHRDNIHGIRNLHFRVRVTPEEIGWSVWLMSAVLQYFKVLLKYLSLKDKDTFVFKNTTT